MAMTYRRSGIVIAALVCLSGVPRFAGAEPQPSARLEKAKDFIADEQWTRAIEV